MEKYSVEECELKVAGVTWIESLEIEERLACLLVARKQSR
jgi:hypothetical protein